jgi:hypothetical protein
MIQGAIAFDVSKLNIHRVIGQVAVYVLAGLLGVTLLSWLTAFVAGLAFHLLLVASEHAAHLDMLTQILMIVVLGYMLKVMVTYSVRGLSSLFCK